MVGGMTIRHAWEEYILPVLLIVAILAVGIPAIALLLALGAAVTVCGWVAMLCLAVLPRHGGMIALAAAIAFSAWVLS